MTHDELRAKIQHYNWVEANDLIQALDAVVELHKPQEKDSPNEHEYCVICPDFEYPCQTIQAIEKELE
jgi:hypothetical protein